HVLVVDDDAGVREYVRAIFLTVPGIITTLAASGEEALAAMRETWFDAVVSDQRMPGLTGTELLERAGTHRESVPTVLMTGFADFRLLEEAMNGAHVSKVIAKPFSPSEMIDA